MADVVTRWGIPPFWTHAPGFAGFVLAILAQQVSLESARTAYIKLENAIGSIEPYAFLTLNDKQLRTVGFSRQKASYVRGLARGIVGGDIDLTHLVHMVNHDARRYLVGIRGIGVWTADVYLLFSLRRTDVWPSGDLALAKAIKDLKGLPVTPGKDKIDRIAAGWKPRRAIAARLLWHYYLSKRGRVAF